MRSFSFVAFALTCALCSPAVAQTRSEANLVLTILGGAVTGHSLWTVDKQALCVLDANKVCTGQYDTLRLSRSINSSVVLGAAGTFFLSPHVGVHAEVAYVGLPSDSDCSPVGTFNTDSASVNEQICNDIRSQAGGGGAIALFGGVTLRAATRRAFSPYVRGSIGLVNRATSTVEVAGVYVDANGDLFERPVILDKKSRRTSVLLGAAVGFTAPLGPGYQFRMEVGDMVAKVDRVTGPANGLADGPTATRAYHHFALTFGFDVVLEQKRGRRY